MKFPLIVVGGQWGDEGKGKVVNLLSEGVDIVARYQGGHNAGHTVRFGEKKYSLHLIPSGILASKKICIIGNGIVLDPEALINEMEKLKEGGVDISHLKISDRCHLLLPQHSLIDRLKEEEKGSSKIGTTGRGIGPCYESKFSREGIRAVFLKSKERLKEEVVRLCEKKNREIKLFFGKDGIDTNEVLRKFEVYSEILSPYITDTIELVNRAIEDGKKVLIEGAQGTMLDIDFGTYPYVTSSSSSAGGACTGLGISPTKIGSVLGVFKAYCTRVGEGPFVTELRSREGDIIRERGNEYGTTTGRPRRCGWFDLVAARYSKKINNFDGIALMLLDVLDVFEKIKVCVAYKYDNQIIEDFPAEPWILSRAEPIYEELNGWKCEIRGLKDFNDLPKEAKDFVRFIEDNLKTKIFIISTGPSKEETIFANEELKRLAGDD